MKKQIKRLSPHQNGKVFGVLIAVSSFLCSFPMLLIFTLVIPREDSIATHYGSTAVMILLIPLYFLIFGYIFIAAGCAIYNLLVKYIGGFEFELEDLD